MLSAEKALTRTERAKTFELDGKPFTRALVLRASTSLDGTLQELKNAGIDRPILEEKTLEAFAASCASTVAFQITVDATKHQGRDAAFFPYEPVPAHAPAVVAFSLFILAGLQGQLKAEGVQVAFPELAASTANLFFLSHPDNERALQVKRGFAVFQSIAKADAENVRSWHDNLMKLIPMYVLQWTTENTELRKVDFMPLFGGMLTGLLSAVE